MDAFFEPKNIKYLSSRQPDIDNAQDVIEYLKMEYHEMMLYASKEVIFSVKAFIENPTHEKFLRTILTMRQDLSKLKNDLDLNDIQIEFQESRQRKTWNRPIRKGRFRRRAEGGFGGNSARPINFGRNLFEFFRTHTANFQFIAIINTIL